MFALYYYDLGELIDPRSKSVSVKIFPLFFTCAKQSCTFVKRSNNCLSSQLSFSTNMKDLNKTIEQVNNLSQSAVMADNMDSSLFSESPTCEEKTLGYQLMILCGDAMSSGNFHSGIVFNKNLVAANKICQQIDLYIDAYPKDENCNLNNNFLRLLFFHGNLSNQKTTSEIINKSVDALINFSALDNDETVFDLPQILIELNDIIICKNCLDKNKLMCENSAKFVKFIVDYSNNDVMRRIIKYLLLPDKYKYNNLGQKFLYLQPAPDILN